MKNLKNICFYVTCGLCVVLIGVLMFTGFSKNSVPVSNAANEDTVFVIDPGHGGEDGGASDASGMLEKDINLDIALALNDMLVATGYKTVMTRSEDISIHDESASSTRERKVSDMHNRLAIINSSPNNVVIGIHQNKFSDSKYSGAQMFYGTKHGNSKVLAESVRNSVVSLLQPENTRELKKADANIYLLHNATVTAMIAECGFLSNPDEASKLADKAYRRQMAFAIYCGVMDYYSAKNGVI